MEKYSRVTKFTTLKEGEIRIGTSGGILGFVQQAQNFFEEGKEFVILRGTGRATTNVIQVAEILKNLIEGLHQQTIPTSMDVVDEWEPLEDGLDTLESHRRITCLEIILSKNISSVDISAPGYQEPLPQSEMNADILKDSKIDSERWANSRSRDGKWNQRGRGAPAYNRGFGGRRRASSQNYYPDPQAQQTANRGSYNGFRPRRGARTKRGPSNVIPATEATVE